MTQYVDWKFGRRFKFLTECIQDANPDVALHNRVLQNGLSAFEKEPSTFTRFMLWPGIANAVLKGGERTNEETVVKLIETAAREKSVRLRRNVFGGPLGIFFYDNQDHLTEKVEQAFQKAFDAETDPEAKREVSKILKIASQRKASFKPGEPHP